jgi:formyltetrahydrofolate deformylase
VVRCRKRNTAILLITCPERKGLVPAVSDFICAHGGDILHADQHQAKDQGLFLMRVEGALEEFDLTPDQFPDAFAPVAQRLHMNWRIEYSEVPTRVAVFVSKEDHCLVDLLHRWRIGELRCEITMVVSNHEDTRALADFHACRSIMFPWLRPTSKKASENRWICSKKNIYRSDCPGALHADPFQRFHGALSEPHHQYALFVSALVHRSEAVSRGV